MAFGEIHVAADLQTWVSEGRAVFLQGETEKNRGGERDLRRHLLLKTGAEVRMHFGHNQHAPAPITKTPVLRYHCSRDVPGVMSSGRHSINHRPSVVDAYQVVHMETLASEFATPPGTI